ncbi:MAG: hypothetical protein JNJ73_15185 [Hyphomonadaceae bacterium]|nr:hypothetical protein [Hyphomonadaceae bacterium]
MRLMLLTFFATLFLTSCQSLYDNAARDECDQVPTSHRSDCYDAVEKNAREHGD